jgi:hypothetical protein
MLKIMVLSAVQFNLAIFVSIHSEVLDDYVGGLVLSSLVNTTEKPVFEKPNETIVFKSEAGTPAFLKKEMEL